MYYKNQRIKAKIKARKRIKIKKYINIEAKSSINSSSMSSMQAKKQTDKEKIIRETKPFMCNPTLMHGGNLNKVICCFCRNNENMQNPTKGILHLGFCGYVYFLKVN